MLPSFCLRYLLFFVITSINLTLVFGQQVPPFFQLKGKIANVNTKKKLKHVSLQVVNTNISTVTNRNGEFLLKVPNNIKKTDLEIEVSSIGYQNKVITVNALSEPKSIVYLTPVLTYDLEAVQINQYKNAYELVKKVFELRAQNYSNQKTVITSFFRETIKKRRKNISLSEAVLDIYKQPYNTSKSDFIKLIRARKKTNYKKLDTVTFKLQGGPYNVLYTDLVKYPEYIFSLPELKNYNFTLGEVTEINGDQIQAVFFEQKTGITSPLYYGKLYINKNQLAVVKADFSLNVSNQQEASQLFIKKKPANVSIHPLTINYTINYRNKNDIWFYSYSKAELSFKVKKRKKLFNSIYTMSIEMATTDWKLTKNKSNWDNIGKIKKSIIMADATVGFSEPKFWGAYNVIEPEKSIETAIKKIQRQLD